jgi:hypothetical protein
VTRHTEPELLTPSPNCLIEITHAQGNVIKPYNADHGSTAQT